MRKPAKRVRPRAKKQTGIGEFQRLIERTYLTRDTDRGVAGSFMWFSEEVGELAEALMGKDKKALEREFADVFAWLVSLASISGVDMEDAIDKYREGCPACRQIPCKCPKK